MKKKIYAVIGVIGSGKDHTCQLLEQQDYQKIAFADTLRELAWAVLDWEPYNSVEYEAFKKTDWQINFPITALGQLQTDHRSSQFISGRQFLQRLGTDARKIIDEDIWLKALKKKIDASEHDKFCISDLRFPNELEFIRSLADKYEVEIVFTDYKSPRYNCTDPHDSEKLAQDFLKQGYKHGDIIFKSFNPKVGDMVILTNDIGIHKAGQTAEIIRYDKYQAYPYIIELANETELSVTDTEITQAIKNLTGL